MITTKELKANYKRIKMYRRLNLLSQAGVCIAEGVVLVAIHKISAYRAFSVEGLEHLLWAQERLDQISKEKIVAVIASLLVANYAMVFASDFFKKKEDSIIRLIKKN